VTFQDGLGDVGARNQVSIPSPKAHGAEDAPWPGTLGGITLANLG